MTVEPVVLDLAPGHVVTSSVLPTFRVRLSCSCGWQHTASIRDNVSSTARRVRAHVPGLDR